MKKLKHTGTYKDGGSKSYTDSNNNKYWRSFKFGERNKSIWGKLFLGDINSKNPVLATEEFILDEKEIIKQ